MKCPDYISLPRPGQETDAVWCPNSGGATRGSTPSMRGIRKAPSPGGVPAAGFPGGPAPHDGGSLLVFRPCQEYPGRRMCSKTQALEGKGRSGAKPPRARTAAPQETGGWFLYLLECRDGTLYTGVTTDLARRFRQHQQGKASRYTRSRLPVVLVYQEPCRDRSTALRRELAVKKLDRVAKLGLVTPGKRSLPGAKNLPPTRAKAGHRSRQIRAGKPRQASEEPKPGPTCGRPGSKSWTAPGSRS